MKAIELIKMIESIKHSRKLYNITQHQLDEESGLSFSTISKVEVGINDIKPDSQNRIVVVQTDEEFDIYEIIQLSKMMKSKSERRKVPMNKPTINKPMTEQPFNEIKKQLTEMEYALKLNKLNAPDQREDTAIKIDEMIQEVKETEIEYTLPNTPNIKRNVDLSTFTHIVLKGKSMLIAALSELQTAIINNQDKNALKIIYKIKINDMYQGKARIIVSMRKQYAKPFETEYKNHKFK